MHDATHIRQILSQQLSYKILFLIFLMIMVIVNRILILESNSSSIFPHSERNGTMTSSKFCV